MASSVKIRQMLEVIKKLVPIMTDEDVSEIGQVLMKITNRLLNNESEEN